MLCKGPYVAVLQSRGEVLSLAVSSTLEEYHHFLGVSPITLVVVEDGLTAVDAAGPGGDIVFYLVVGGVLRSCQGHT